MKKYYVTCTIIDSSGIVFCNIVGFYEAEKKPKTFSHFTSEYDAIFDYFGSEEDALNYVKATLRGYKN